MRVRKLTGKRNPGDIDRNAKSADRNTWTEKSPRRSKKPKDRWSTSKNLKRGV